MVYVVAYTGECAQKVLLVACALWAAIEPCIYKTVFEGAGIGPVSSTCARIVLQVCVPCLVCVCSV